MEKRLELRMAGEAHSWQTSTRVLGLGPLYNVRFSKDGEEGPPCVNQQSSQTTGCPSTGPLTTRRAREPPGGWGEEPGTPGGGPAPGVP